MANDMREMRNYRPNMQDAISDENRRVLARRDAQLGAQRQHAELEGRTARADNDAPQGGRSLGDDWPPDNWQAAARQQADDARARRFADAQAYKTRLRNAGQRVRQQFEDVLQRRNAGLLEAVNNSFRNGYATSVYDKEALGGEMSDESNVYEGAMWIRPRTGGKGFLSVSDGLLKNSRMAQNDRFAVATRNPQDGGIRYSLFSPVDILRKNKDLQVLDPDVESRLIDIILDSGVPENRVRDTIGYMPNRDPDAITNRVTGGAGGRDVGGVTVSGGTARRLFGMGGGSRSRISFFGTGGAGTGYTMREYNGHTGEDTGLVDDPIRQGRTAALAKGRWKVMSIGPSEDGKTQVRVYENEQTGERRTIRDGQGLPQNQEAVELAEATRRGKGGRTFEEEKELARIRSDSRIRENEAAQAGHERIEGLKTERDRERQRSLYKRFIGTIRIKTAAGERMLTPEEMSDAMKNYDADNPVSQSGQAASSVGDNKGGEKWGSLTPAQIEKVKAKGEAYDEKTGEIFLPNGKRMKV